MSVNYSAKYGYGFAVSADEINKISNELIDDFMDSEFHTFIDCYDNNAPHFFGLILHSAEPGWAIALPAVDNYSRNDFQLMLKQFKKFFPNHSTSTIKHYLISTVS